MIYRVVSAHAPTDEIRIDAIGYQPDLRSGVIRFRTGKPHTEPTIVLAANVLAIIPEHAA